MWRSLSHALGGVAVMRTAAGFAAIVLVSALLTSTPSAADRGARERAGSQVRIPAELAPLDDVAEVQGAYERALEDLAHGRGAEGQRRLELLIVRHPDSPHAHAARAALARIYQAVAQAPLQNRLGGPSPVQRNTPSHGWTVEVARVSPAAASFRDVAGDRVFFASGSAELGGRARNVLKRQAEWLASHPAASIRIEGYSDDPGSTSENIRLASQRAEAVRRTLVEDGVRPQRIVIDVRGRDGQVALCRDAICSAQNRRVVTVVEGAVAMSASAGDWAPRRVGE